MQETIPFATLTLVGVAWYRGECRKAYEFDESDGPSIVEEEVEEKWS